MRSKTFAGRLRLKEFSLVWLNLLILIMFAACIRNLAIIPYFIGYWKYFNISLYCLEIVRASYMRNMRVVWLKLLG